MCPCERENRLSCEAYPTTVENRGETLSGVLQYLLPTACPFRMRRRFTETNIAIALVAAQQVFMERTCETAMILSVRWRNECGRMDILVCKIPRATHQDDSQPVSVAFQRQV